MAAPARRSPGYVSKAYQYNDDLAVENRNRDRKARNSYMAAMGGATSPASIPVGFVGGLAAGMDDDTKELSSDFYSAGVGGLFPGISVPVGLGRGAYLNHKSYQANRDAGRAPRSHRLRESNMAKRAPLSYVRKDEGYPLDEGDASHVQHVDLVPTGRQAGAAEGLTYVRNRRGKGGPNRLERYSGGGMQSTGATAVTKARGFRGRIPSADRRGNPYHSPRPHSQTGDYDAWPMDTHIRETKEANARSQKRRRAVTAAGAGAATGAAAGTGYAASRRRKGSQEEVGKVSIPASGAPSPMYRMSTKRKAGLGAAGAAVGGAGGAGYARGRRKRRSESGGSEEVGKAGPWRDPAGFARSGMDWVSDDPDAQQARESGIRSGRAMITGMAGGTAGLAGGSALDAMSRNNKMRSFGSGGSSALRRAKMQRIGSRAALAGGAGALGAGAVQTIRNGIDAERALSDSGLTADEAFLAREHLA